MRPLTLFRAFLLPAASVSTALAQDSETARVTQEVLAAEDARFAAMMRADSLARTRSATGSQVGCRFRQTVSPLSSLSSASRDRLLSRSLQLFTSLILLGLATPATAQTVRGRVAVVEIADPIAGAAVVLTSVDGTPHDAVLSDSLGQFELTADGAGVYVVRVHAPGFRPATSAPLELGGGTKVEVRVNLRRTAFLIEGVTVVGEARYSGFHARRRDARTSYRFGSFDTDDIQRVGASRVADLFREVPLFQGRCFTLWVDGQLVKEGDWRYGWVLGTEQGPPMAIDWVYGVEVFRNRSEAPRAFQWDSDAHCGVVLVWTTTIGRR